MSAQSTEGKLLSYSPGSPTVLRILLGTQLRRLRTEKGISREDAGYSIRASHAKISRLELGQVSFKQRDVADLLTLYGVTDPEEREPLLALAKQANAPGWWHKYGDLLPAWFEVYIGLEGAAAGIRTYENQFVPGLLQTPAYARAVIELAHEKASQDELERRVALRMTRQGRLESGLTLWAVIDEAVVRRTLGSPEIMREQIAHLLEVTAERNITVQIMPFDRGGHAAAGGSFSILRFPERELPDVVYMEQLTSALYLDKAADCDHYMEVMDRLSIQAEEPKATRRFLERLISG
ncbi:helix-turn-helix domain-containing protein [Nonomuraea gerenzanensis]|uniref:Putative DNA-binding protein in cluster with Type I restriction-modification system n=1 Tax=Nonomuraea gerenzanensis TaxID=93944 RepID=A0A1M4EJN1_9ACTN|nr:helix-turn-helix transcriptional regulator [Nonomuraea gerenzanensis]UBU10644.1 helix-turn-helix domain-containing protein [Nonomuraea gerenzanensis]SBO99062.1 Putative DNA-binding protein in cluster with Type I restriction-modification system [Nonomuraea gerenzanensis]